MLALKTAFLMFLIPQFSQARNPLQEALNSVHCEMRAYTLRVEVVDCQPRDVTINACIGTCLSYTAPGRSGNTLVNSCTCCQPTDTKSVSVGLWCKDPKNPSGSLVEYYHTIKSATECSCISCWMAVCVCPYSFWLSVCPDDWLIHIRPLKKYSGLSASARANFLKKIRI